MEWTWFLCPRGRSKWVDYSSKSPFAPALARCARRGRETNIHSSTTLSIESRARSSRRRRQVSSSTKDPRARVLRVGTSADTFETSDARARARCASKSARNVQIICINAPSNRYRRACTNSRLKTSRALTSTSGARRCDVQGVHLVLTPGARARAWWDFLFFMKRRFDDKILH